MASSLGFRSIGPQHYVLEFNMETANASTSGFTALSSNPYPIDGYVIKVVTNPGATGPTDDYDITLTDSESCDCMGGALADRDITNSEQTWPIIGGTTYGESFVEGPLTCNISNNAVKNATTKVSVYFRRPA